MTERTMPDTHTRAAVLQYLYQQMRHNESSWEELVEVSLGESLQALFERGLGQSFEHLDTSVTAIHCFVFHVKVPMDLQDPQGVPMDLVVMPVLDEAGFFALVALVDEHGQELRLKPDVAHRAKEQFRAILFEKYRDATPGGPGDRTVSAVRGLWKTKEHDNAQNPQTPP